MVADPGVPNDHMHLVNNNNNNNNFNSNILVRFFRNYLQTITIYKSKNNNKKLEISIYDGILLNSRAYEGNVCLNSVSFRARLKDANEALCLSSLCKLFHV